MKFKHYLYNHKYLEEFTYRLLKGCFELQKEFTFEDYDEYLAQVQKFFENLKERI